MSRVILRILYDQGKEGIFLDVLYGKSSPFLSTAVVLTQNYKYV